MHPMVKRPLLSSPGGTGRRFAVPPGNLKGQVISGAITPVSRMKTPVIHLEGHLYGFYLHL